MARLKVSESDKVILRSIQDFASFWLSIEWSWKSAGLRMQRVITTEGEFEGQVIDDYSLADCTAIQREDVESPPVKPPEWKLIRECADKIESLEFPAKTCEVCGKDLGPLRSESMVYKLLSGKYVVPYIGVKKSAEQQWLQFPTAHLLCRLAGKRISKLVESTQDLDFATAEKQIDEEVMGAMDDILKEAQAKVPTLSEVDVKSSIVDILNNLYPEESIDGDA